jgi:hypothetical protein
MIQPVAGGHENITALESLEGASVKFANSTDESLLAYYESVRRQLSANSQLGGRFRLIGAHVRLYADELRAEMERRHMRFRPIEWPRQ